MSDHRVADGCQGATRKQEILDFRWSSWFMHCAAVGSEPKTLTLQDDTEYNRPKERVLFSALSYLRD